MTFRTEGRAGGPEKGGPTVEAVEWGFRLLAGRSPLSDGEVNAYLAIPDLDSMRRTFANTHEFHAFFGSFLTGVEAWTVPLFLLRPPKVPGLAWRFAPPDLHRPTSQLCTASQCRDAAFAEIGGAMGFAPGVNRSRWEQAWIVAILATEGLIGPGHRGLGLLTEDDRVTALVASRGAEVLATEPPREEGSRAEVLRTQYFYPKVVSLEAFDQLVRFAELDPASVGKVAPATFDFCWSRGMPQRLGSVAAALDFFEASMAPLRPGGIAAHTFAFNLTSNGLTWDGPNSLLLRRCDIEALAERLHRAGHALLPLNTHPGDDIEDETVQSALHGAPGLRQRIGMMVTTSFGVAIRKGAAAAGGSA